VTDQAAPGIVESHTGFVAGRFNTKYKHGQQCKAS
jgi:hypothetical protein